MPTRFQKWSVGIITALVLFTSAGGSLLYAEPAQAQFSAIITGNLPELANKIKEGILTGLKVALLNATVRIVSYALKRLAFDSAVWLASGGKGQGAQAFTKGAGDYFKSVADDAVGHGIEELSQHFGVDLCKIPDLRVDVSLRMGLRTGFADTYGPRKPVCNFTQFSDAWLNGDAWKSKFNSGVNLAVQFNASLEPGQTPIGTLMAVRDSLNQQAAAQLEGQKAERAEGQGIKASKTNVSNDNKIPAVTNKKQFEEDSPAKLQEQFEAQVRALLTSGEIKVIPTILTSFLNTLVSTMVKNYQQYGILPFGIGYTAPGSGGGQVTQYTSAGTLGGRSQAQAMFSSILSTPDLSPTKNFDLLGELNNCESEGTYNCRIDNGMLLAVQETAGGVPTTIGEAITKGFLHASWKLIPPIRIADNTDRKGFCQNNNYCYSNIKVLRQVRLLPLGFEIAAKLSNPDKPWTLGQVVGSAPDYKDGFNDCTSDQLLGKVGFDPKHPFCHLIDPNWIVKLPATRCNALGYGAATLDASIPDRLRECVDLSSCVAVDPVSKICTQYAYCAREKNVWNFDADSCEAEWRTCRTFTKVGQNETVSYLQRSVDTSYCSAKVVGCQAYSLAQDPNGGGWIAPVTPVADSGYINAGIYLNGKLPSSDSCSLKSAGCSVFQPTAGGEQPIYLRKAPDYLRCYDADLATVGVQWPTTPAQMSALAIRASTECSNYAAACIKDEVGCRKYTASDTKEEITGKVTGDTMCNQACVGYDAYREMPSTYANGESLVYVAPSTGATCSESDAGCTSFTNLKTGGSQEQLEYFSYIQPCNVPDKNNQKNFVTYEGSASGFQLKVYTLVKDSTGGPQYFYNTLDDLTKFQTLCNANTYKGGDLDCRQFNDDQGNTYYRLLSKTIPVSESCTPYRLNHTELYTYIFKGANGQAVPAGLQQSNCADAKGFWDTGQGRCQLCFEGGEYRDGFCYYQGLPNGVAVTSQASRTCSAQVDSCREFKGPSGNNLKILAGLDTFERATTSAQLPLWQGTNVSISSESTHAGEHSLGVRGQGVVLNRALINYEAPSVGGTYVVTFWAKGSGTANGNNLTVRLATDDGNNTISFGSHGLSDAWQYYRFGPFSLGTATSQLGATTSAKIFFENQVNGSLFVDNFELQQGGDSLFFVKNSLSIPASCDADPNDGLPGAALGCRAYTDDQSKTVYLTGFNFLCRFGAIGCAEVLDTYNTVSKDAKQQYVVTPDDQGPQLYNVWLPGNVAGGETLKLTLNGKELASCSTVVGEVGCYVTIKDAEPADVLQATVNNGAASPQLVTSTIYIPGDTSSSLPIYLVNNNASICTPADVGCTLAGAVENTPTGPHFTTTSIKNDPALYTDMLCAHESLGCSEYADSAGGQTFFKDPTIAGQKICAYQNTVNQRGWFWKGVGTCSVDATVLCTTNADCGAPKVCSGDTTIVCSTNTDCTGNGTCKANTCESKSIGSVPCYKNYVGGDGAYGLWSQGDTDRYQGFVGECPTDKNLCTEFVDHNDNKHAYYFIKNDKISSGDCAGQVSQKKGCALFEETDNPSVYWSTYASYQASDAVSNAVTPVAITGGNDANTIIKVKADRECGEWLQCRLSDSVYDKTANQYKKVCYLIGRCNQAGPSAEAGDTNDCGNWIDGLHAYSDQKLTTNLYINRPIGWQNMDFDGYSIPDLYPLEEFKQVNLSSDLNKPEWHLAKLVPCGSSNCQPNAPASSFACATNNAVCGASGWCINNFCLRGLEGTGNQNAIKNVPAQICRAYPEVDAPFPNLPEITPKVKSTTQPFTGIHVCHEWPNPTSVTGRAYACECDYTKVNYGNVLTRYWNYYAPNTLNGSSYLKTRATLPGEPDGFCVNGNYDGSACKNDDDCRDKPTDQSICEKKVQETSFLGWRGFCLEDDTSRIKNGDNKLHPCLTWYPIDNLLGTTDINDQHPEAGYVTNNVGQYYCASGGGLAVPNRYSINPFTQWVTRPVKNIYGQPPQIGSGDFLNFDSSGDNKGDPFEANDTRHKYNGGEIFGFCLLGPTACTAAGTAMLDNNQFRRQTFVPNDVEQAINMPNIQIIKLLVNNGAPEDAKNGVYFEIWPNDFTANKDAPQVTYKVETNAGAGDEGYAVTGRYLGKSNEFILFYANKREYLDTATGDVCFGGTSANHNNPPCRYLGGNVFKQLTILNGTTNLGAQGIWSRDQNVTNEGICPYTGDNTGGDNGGSNGGGNWHAIRLRFSATAPYAFLGYDTAYCDDSAEDGAISYRVSFDMKLWCPVVGDALVDYVNPNKHTAPLTNRLWPAVQPPFVILDGNYKVSDAFPEFGSLSTLSAPARSQVFMNPYDQTCLPGEQPPTGVKECITVRDNSQLASGGQGYGTSQGGYILGNIFANLRQGYRFNNTIVATTSPNGGQTYSYIGYEPTTLYDYTESGFPSLNANSLQQTKTPYDTFPPQIAPLGEAVEGMYAEDHTNNKLGMSINGKSSGVVKIFNTAGKAVLRWFAWASEDQLPLREIHVDWGDGAVAPRLGVLQNHRGSAPQTCNKTSHKCEYNEPVSERCRSRNSPICSGSLTCNTNTYWCERTVATNDCETDNDCKPAERCSTDPATWGYLKDKACVSNPFLQEYTYQCDAASKDVSGKSVFHRPEEGVCGDGFPRGCCIFTPRVQVKDNWGWCNGSCGRRYQNGMTKEGCYDGSNQDPATDNECDVKYPDTSNPNYYPWTDFDGQILVAPK